MEEVKNKLHKRLHSIKLFLAGWVIAMMVGGSFFVTYRQCLIDACMVKHNIIMSALKRNISLGGQIPKSITDLGSLEYVSTTEYQRFGIAEIVGILEQHYSFEYYPEGLGKPGKILFLSSLPGSFVITFGDGSRAVVSAWYPEFEDVQRSLKAKVDITFLITFSVIPIIIFIMLSLSERIIRRRKAQTSEEVSNGNSTDEITRNM